jgi:uncharacterized protein (TIGR02996 family)
VTKNKDQPPPPPPQYVRHTGSPAWGVGLLVGEAYDQRTYLFADGVARTFKTALVAKFIEPAGPPGDEDRARLERGVAAVTSVAAAATTPGVARGTTATPKAIHLEIEAEIRSAGDDDSPYLVYADWLQARNDPRGQLIVTQHALARDPANKRLRDAERALLAEHGNYFVPPTLAALLAARRKNDPDATTTELVWRCGFIERARLARKTPRQPELEVALAELLAHPSAQFLRSLTLGAFGTTDQYSYVSMLDAIAGARPPSLEELIVGAFTSEQFELAFSRAGDLSQLLAALPGLRRLVVRAGALRFATAVKHAGLRELVIVTAELSATTARKLTKLAMPALVALELEAPELGLDGAVLAANKSLSQLRRFAARRTIGTLGLVRAIAAAPFAAALEELDVSDGDLNDAAARQIAHDATRLPRLRRLVLDGNRISAAARTNVEAACAAVTAARLAPVTIVSVDDAIARAPDAASVVAARKVARPADWLALGRDDTRLWGEYEGSDHYWVWASLRDDRAGCSCPSPKQPCKHAIALLLLAAANHPFPERPVPGSAIRHASVERPRYDWTWE